MRQGVYFSLSELEYHADPALGSSSMKQLAISPVEYWFASVHNPLRPDDEDKPSLVLGSAFHKLVLEGRDAFERAYGCAHFNGSTKAGKEESAAIEAAGKIRLKLDDWQRILLADGAVKANPALVNAFTGGPTEVSIFWTTKDGIPKKARIDCLKVRSNSDLKTIAPKNDNWDFPRSCRQAFDNYAYKVQAWHYNEGRSYLEAFLSEGLVYGDHDATLLKSIAAEKSWASVFTFLKKKGAPDTWACSLPMLVKGNGRMIPNPVLEDAQGIIERAESNYLAFVETFGLDQPWLSQRPIEELAREDLLYPYGAA